MIGRSRVAFLREGDVDCFTEAGEIQNPSGRGTTEFNFSDLEMDTHAKDDWKIARGSAEKDFSLTISGL